MLTGTKQEKVKLEKVEKEENERERKGRKKKQKEGQRIANGEKDATAEMRIRYGEITGQCKSGTRMA